MNTKVNKVWSKQHYNALAKEIRQMYSEVNGDYSDSPGEEMLAFAARHTLEEIALRLAKRFKKDSDEATAGWGFDPIKFLDACSPNTDLYPLSELWED